MMPFTAEQFFGVFRSHNETFWPVQLVLLALGLAAAGLLFDVRPSAGRLLSAVLALFWAWMAVAYHFLYFAAINPAAWIFGTLFLIEAALLFWMGVVRGGLRFTERYGVRAWTGGLLLLYALLVYPLLSAWLGRAYLDSPTFGLPCPTVIFTLGLFLLLREPFSRLVLIVPILWTGVGTLGAFQLGVPEDFGLLAAGLAGLILALPPHRRREPFRSRMPGGERSSRPPAGRRPQLSPSAFREGAEPRRRISSASSLTESIAFTRCRTS